MFIEHGRGLPEYYPEAILPLIKREFSDLAIEIKHGALLFFFFLIRTYFFVFLYLKSLSISEYQIKNSIDDLKSNFYCMNLRIIFRDSIEFQYTAIRRS